MLYHDSGITYMPFSDKQLEELDEAAKSRQLIKISSKVRAEDKKAYTFAVEIGSFREKDDEDYSYYEELWEDSSLLVYIDVEGDSWSHGGAEKISDLINLGARAFIAKVFNVTPEGKLVKKKKTKETGEQKMKPRNHIEYVDINTLYPHPDNPRKNIGDVTELAESIKAQGIMQNLTIVERFADGKRIPGEYTVIIGHRRLAAAKLAGLESVPCVIAYGMSEKDQLATMLLENMQRTDLTVYEQAQGFQLMMDLGESIESISEKTGFSKKTVRNRIKLNRYDKELMKAAEVRQPTFEQYMKLSEIEDDEKANYVLRFIGTKNFDHEVEKAIKAEKEKRERDKYRTELAGIAEELEDASYNAIEKAGLVSIKSLYTPFTEANLAYLKEQKEKYGKLYFSEGYGFTIYRKKCKEDTDALEEAKAKRRAIDELSDRAKTIYQTMKDRAERFITEYHRKDQVDILLGALVDACVAGKMSGGHSYYGIANALGWEYPEDLKTWNDDYEIEATSYIMEKYDNERCRAMLHIIWYGMEIKEVCFMPYHGKKLEQYHEASGWMFRLALLSDLGYNVSDEEWAFCSGSHPIYSEEVER